MDGAILRVGSRMLTISPPGTSSDNVDPRHPLAPSVNMSSTSGSIWVRPFRYEDAVQVRDLFLQGLCDGEDSARKVAMRTMLVEPVALPSYPLFGLGLGLSTFGRSSTVRMVGGLVSAASLVWVGFLRWNVSRSVRAYCAMSMEDDLVDIAEHYRVTGHEKENHGGVSHFWVAETEREDGTKVIVGCVGIDSSTQADKSYTELRRMSIHRSYRRRGIGSLLLNALVSYAKEHGAKKVVLSTTSWQGSARKMYERFGWVDIRQDNYSWFMRRGKVHFLELDV